MSASLLVEPAHTWVPESFETAGPEVADLSRLVGLNPDPEQQLILDATFAIDRNHRPSAFEVAVVVGRQNMKTAVFKMMALGWLYVTDERLVVWSAHEFATAQEAFRDMDQLIESNRHFSRRVKKVHRGNGDEAIELVDDRRLVFKTRTKGGGRGLSGDKVILDEAFALKPMHMGALLPTLSARPAPQVVYGSSAGLMESGVLRGVRDRGRAGGEPSLAYFEWGAPPPKESCRDGDACTHALDAKGCGCDNPELWQVANPAIGRRITLDYVASERRALPPEEFARERMSWWDDPIGGETPIPADKWTESLDEKSKIQDPVAIAVDITPDRSTSTIAIAGRRADGKVHAEISDHKPGTGWVVDRLIEIAERWNACAVVIDPAGPAGSLEKKLIEKGFTTDGKGAGRRLHMMGTREYAQACGALTDDIVNGQFRHLGQPELDAAVDGVRTRPLADAYAWSRGKSSASISPLVAVTLARHGHATHGAVKKPAPFFLRG